MEIKEIVAHAYNLAASANNAFSDGREEDAKMQLGELRDYLDDQLKEPAAEVTDQAPLDPG